MLRKEIENENTYEKSLFRIKINFGKHKSIEKVSPKLYTEWVSLKT